MSDRKLVADGKIRKNITLSIELKEWYEKQASAFGCSASSMMVIALSQYKQQMESLGQLKDLPGLLEQLQSLQEKQEQIKND